VLLCIVAGGATWATEPVLEQAAREAVRSGRLVTLVIEQDGHQTLAADGGTVVLERAPFILWVIHETDGGILLQVSNASLVYDAIGFESALVRGLGSDAGQVMGLAEGVYNSERTLYADTFSAHYLPNPRTSIDHRYNRLHLGNTERDFTVGGRDVEFIFDLTGQNKRRAYPVSATPFDELFISAIVSIHDANYMPYILDFHRVRIEFLQ
jgi:hypothetical protein